MRVLYFHQYFSTPRGAGGNRSYWMAMALVEAGHDVHLVCGNSYRGHTGLTMPFKYGMRSGNVDGIKVTEIELNYSNYLSLFKRTLLFLKFALYCILIALREKYDLVFCSSTPLTASLPGIVARWLRGKIFVFEVRDLWPELPKEMGVITNPLVLGCMSALEWMSYRSAHACIGLSPGIVAGIKKRNRSEQPVRMIPNGCDLNVFGDSPIESVETEGIYKSDFVAIFTGAHGMANGLDAVLDAAKILLDERKSHIKFLFLGDGKLKPTLEKRKLEENLTNCVFLSPVPKGRLYNYLRRANVALMVLRNVPAFYYGTSPNKFFDYLTAGKPILNNYPGWLADIIIENDIGVVVPPDSPQEFANALYLLSIDQSSLNEMETNSFKLANTRFDRRLFAEEFVGFLERQVSPPVPK